MNNFNNIFIASDHAGFALKASLCSYMNNNNNYKYQDIGTDSTESVDYPFYAKKLAYNLKDQPKAMGILLCGTGVGMSIMANRYNYIRGALVFNEQMAKLSREHNNANVLIMGAKILSDFVIAHKCLDLFYVTDFLYGRHTSRVNNLVEL